MAFKRIRQRFFKSDIAPILVSSYGRSGSTLIYDSVCKAMSLKRFGMQLKLVNDNAWDIQSTKFRNGVVYKSHDYPDDLINSKNLRAIFVFGSPKQTVRSVILQDEKEGREWTNLHLSHLKSDDSFKNILSRDVLGLEKQLNAWTKASSVPTLSIKFDNIWENLPVLSDFIDLEIKLPPKRERKARILGEEKESCLEETYGELERRYEEMPAVILNKSKHA